MGTQHRPAGAAAAVSGCARSEPGPEPRAGPQPPSSAPPAAPAGEGARGIRRPPSRGPPSPSTQLQSSEGSGAQETRTPARLGPLCAQPRDVTGFLTQNTTCMGREDGSDRGTGATYYFPREPGVPRMDRGDRGWAGNLRSPAAPVGQGLSSLPWLTGQGRPLE